MRNFKLIIILGLCSLTFLALQFCFMRYVSGQKKVRIYHILHNISILHRHIKRRHIINKTTNTSTKESFKCSQSVIIILHSPSTNQIYIYLGVWNIPEQMHLQSSHDRIASHHDGILRQSPILGFQFLNPGYTVHSIAARCSLFMR